MFWTQNLPLHRKQACVSRQSSEHIVYCCAINRLCVVLKRVLVFSTKIWNRWLGMGSCCSETGDLLDWPHHSSISISPLVPSSTSNSVQYIMGTAPSYLCDRLQLYTPSRRRNLHSASNILTLQIPCTRLSTVGSHAFSVFGPSTWNDLPLITHSSVN